MIPRLLEEQLDCWRNGTLLIDVEYEPKKNGNDAEMPSVFLERDIHCEIHGVQKIHQNTTFNPYVYYLPALGDQEWIQSCANFQENIPCKSRGGPRCGKRDPYYSHIFRNSGLGVVWE